MYSSENEVFYVCSCYGESINLSDWKALYPDDDFLNDNDDLIISIWSKGLRKNNKRGIIARLRMLYHILFKDNLYTDEIILNKDDAVSMAEWIIDRYYEAPIDEVIECVLSEPSESY
jgi:hypothetical protein